MVLRENYYSMYLLLQPGQSSERVIDEGNVDVGDESVQNWRFDVPCERDIRKQLHEEKTPSQSVRKIGFHGDGSNVKTASDLPFQPPGLKWNAGDAITTRQLLAQRDARMGKQIQKD